MRALARNDK
ncbi:hypothetical protein A2U01_0099706, partial [Trifolium medium]|nr:hypothetical protein [Trifolium medium]